MEFNEKSMYLNIISKKILFLWQISSITADNVDTYKNAVNKLTDCMDANIKTMYTVMAKTEELSNKMKNTEALAARM